MSIEFTFLGEKLFIETSQYQKGGLAVPVYDAENAPYAVLSVWLPTSPTLPADVFFLKEWGENEEISAAAIDAGVVVPVPGIAPQASGFVESIRAFRLAPQAQPDPAPEPQGAPVVVVPNGDFAAEARAALLAISGDGAGVTLQDLASLSDADFSHLLFGPQDYEDIT